MKATAILLLFAILGAFAALPGTAKEDQPPTPVWELSATTLDAATKVGTVTFESGSVGLDGTNALTLPPDVLGDQTDYTIEFEVNRPPETTSGHRLRLVSNADEENTLAERRMDTVPEGSKDSVHWNAEVSRAMSALIIAEIEKALGVPQSKNEADAGSRLSGDVRVMPRHRLPGAGAGIRGPRGCGGVLCARGHRWSAWVSGRRGRDKLAGRVVWDAARAWG